MTTRKVLNGRPDVGSQHVRFDEGEVALAKPRRGSLLYTETARYKKLVMSALALAAALCSSVVIAAYDVVVVGAGPAGIGAALAAARAGAKTALVERDSSVGGTTVQADITEIGLFHAWRRQIIAGPAWDLVTNAVAASHGSLPDFSKQDVRKWNASCVRVDAAVYSRLAEEALRNAGVYLRLGVEANSVERIPGGGWRTGGVEGRMVVDATGNASVAALAGAERVRSPDAERQPGSYFFHFTRGLPFDAAAVDRRHREAVKSGELLATDVHIRMSDFIRNGGGGGCYIPLADNSTPELRAEAKSRLAAIGHIVPRSPGREWRDTAGRHVSFSPTASNGVVKASSFGFNPEDATEILQKTLDSGARKIVIDRQASPWVTRPLFARSNCEIVFERGVEVVAKKGEFLGKGDSLLTLDRVENVKLSGYGATLRMHRADYAAPPYTKAEWRMSINLRSCRNVTIEGLSLVESGGDGVYLGVSRKGEPCRDIVLRDLVCDRQYRQGISVISARNLLIERCVLRNTGGTPPAAGIDFEPNRPSEELDGIVMRDCTISDNQGTGLAFYFGQLDSTSKPISIKIENCRSRGNAHGFGLSNGRKGTFVRGRVTCENCTFESERGYAVRLRRKPDDSVVADFVNCRFINCQTNVFDAAWRDTYLVKNVLANAPKRRAFDSALARPFDSRPGELVRLKPFRFRYGVTYRFFMAAPGEARFSGRFTKVGRPPFTPKPLVIKDAAGKTCATIHLNGTDETPFSFTAKTAGFYTMTADVGSHAFGLTATSVPIAVTPTGLDRSIYATQGTLFFRAAADTPFVVAVSGANPAERVRAQVADPNGRVVWDCDRILEWATYRSDEHPADGLWRITFRSPSGCTFEDFSVLQQGAAPDFFLTPEKCW